MQHVSSIFNLGFFFILKQLYSLFKGLYGIYTIWQIIRQMTAYFVADTYFKYVAVVHCPHKKLCSPNSFRFFFSSSFTDT